MLERLGDDASTIERFLLEVPSDEGIDGAAMRRSGWTTLTGNPERARDLAAGFGAVRWDDGAGTPVVTLRVAVIDRSGVVVGTFGGMTTWEDLELLAALVAALRS